MSADNIARLAGQINLMNRAIGRPFDAVPAVSDELVIKLATFLDQNGTTSILNLSQFQDVATNVAFFYDRVTGFVYPNLYGSVYTAGVVSGLNVFTTLGHERFNYIITIGFSADGFPVFLAQARDTGSDWVDYKGGLIFVASVVVSAAFPALGASIGDAIFAGSVPAALSTAVGNVAVASVLNGGDVKSAVVGAVSGGIGNAAGSIVATATDAQWIGNAASAATSAAIKGGDPVIAVGASLVNSGVRNMDDLFNPTDVSDFSNMDFDGSLLQSGDSTGYTFGGDVTTGYSSPGYYTDSNGITYGYDAAGDLVVIDQVDSSGIGYYTDDQGDIMVADSSPPQTTQVTNPANVPPPAGSGVDSTNYGALIAAGLSLVRAYQAANAPAVRTYSATTQARSNGTVAQVINGKVVSTKPPVGVPFQMATGGIITNNGDGTYTTILPNGQTTVSSYPANMAVGTVNPNLLMYAAIGVGALLILRR